MLTSRKTEARRRRHHRLRMHLRGTTERPRLAVFRSLNHIYAQIIDDAAGRTLAAADSRSPDFRQRGTSGGNVSGAKAVGELLAERAKARGITQVIFDRGGHKYHGRVKALAESARAGGLKF